MDNEDIAKKFASLIGTTAAITVTVGSVGFLTAGSFYVPPYTHQITEPLNISSLRLSNPYEIQISLQSEETDDPVDITIPIPIVSQMVFKFNNPVKKEFQI